MENENKNNRNPRNLQVITGKWFNIGKQFKYIFFQGLLRFAMEATKSEDAPSGDHQFQRMDPERRNFLGKLKNIIFIFILYHKY